MRVLFISPSSAMTGATVALVNLAKGLSTSCELAVIMPDKSGPAAHAMKDLGAKVYHDRRFRLDVYPHVLNPIKHFRRMRKLRHGNDKVRAYFGKVMDDFRPDIVHTNVGPLDYAIGECQKRGIPHVWHIREFTGGKTRLDFFPNEATYRVLLHSEGNHCIAISNKVFDHYELRPSDKVIFDGVIDDSLDVPSSVPADYMVYAGRIESSKGLMTLLKAWRMFSKVHPHMILKVAGKSCGLYAVRCKLYAKLCKLNVKFIGNQDRADLLALYKGAVAVVVPSLSEGFGFVSVEAMACNTTVIARDTTGLKEQMDLGEAYTGAPIALRFKTVSELQKALGDAVSNIFDDMHARAYKTVYDHYTIANNSQAVLAYYQEILSKA